MDKKITKSGSLQSISAAKAENGKPTVMSRVIGVGEMVVAGVQSLILQAHLGTCVGLTLCDLKNRVGGIIHFLLPEPVGKTTSHYPERYASIGLPFFIDKMLAAGAEPDQLAAVVAGGALVGPISSQDLNLDIGGRTTEVVERMLAEAGIPILRSETGGYFTCRLSLDLSTLRSDIEPLGRWTAMGESLPGKMSRQDLAQVLTRLKPIPQIALKLMRMIPDSQVSLTELADEVRKDQTISAGVINLCNSAMMRRVQPVESIDRALVVLGEKQLLKIFLSAALEGFLHQDAGGYSLCRGGLYHHAVGTALAAEQLAVFTKAAPPDVAYTAGLLHDIGKVALDQFLAKAAPLFYRRVHQEDLSMMEAEKEILGFDHCEVGGMMAELWGLPDSLAQAILHHHFPEKAPSEQALVHLVYLADLLLSRFKVGVEMESMDTLGLAHRLAVLGLTSADFPALVEALPVDVLAMDPEMGPGAMDDGGRAA